MCSAGLLPPYLCSQGWKRIGLTTWGNRLQYRVLDCYIDTVSGGVASHPSHWVIPNHIKAPPYNIKEAHLLHQLWYLACGILLRLVACCLNPWVLCGHRYNFYFYQNFNINTKRGRHYHHALLATIRCHLAIGFCLNDLPDLLQLAGGCNPATVGWSFHLHTDNLLRIFGYVCLNGNFKVSERSCWKEQSHLYFDSAPCYAHVAGYGAHGVYSLSGNASGSARQTFFL